MGATKWADLKNRKLSRERQARIAEGVHKELVAMDLRELRREAGQTQAATAELAEMTQAEISKIERRDDHLLSTLRRYVEALGGKLEIVAVLGDKRITLRSV